jgi:hypothetical protein
MDRLLLVPLLLLGAACAPAAAPGQPVPTPVHDVAQARAAGPGATLLVEGVISVPPGAFDGGFAIQDRTGGLWVLPPSTGLPLRIGQRVRVHGTLDLRHGQLSLQPAAIQPLGMRAPPLPLRLATGRVDDDAEGWLVRVAGRVIGEAVHDAPWGWRVTLDDGSGPVTVFVDAETDVDPAVFRPGERVDVTGFTGRYDARLEILPRAAVDVLPASR